MKRYMLNKLNTIDKNLHKQNAEPIKILYVSSDDNEINATLSTGTEQVRINFKTENDLENYVELNSLPIVIQGLNIDKI